MSLTQVGGHAGALVFMIGTLAGLAGGGRLTAHDKGHWCMNRRKRAR